MSPWHCLAILFPFSLLLPRLNPPPSYTPTYLQKVGPLYLEKTEAAILTSPSIENDHMVLPDGEAHKDMVGK